MRKSYCASREKCGKKTKICGANTYDHTGGIAMDLLRKFLTSVGAAAAIGVMVPVHAAPEKYVLDHHSTATDPGGWFIYDRDTSTLIDYSIVFDTTSYPSATFTYPATSIVSATSSGFSFSDVTTTFGLGQSFTVHLGSFGPGFGPFKVTFAAGSLGLDSTGTHSLIGGVEAPIYWEGQFIGAVMNLVGYFYDAGPVVSAVPEPETYAMLVAGLGLLGWRLRRRGRKQVVAT